MAEIEPSPANLRDPGAWERLQEEFWGAVERRLRERRMSADEARRRIGGTRRLIEQRPVAEQVWTLHGDPADMAERIAATDLAALERA
jgi:hypothetical protein